LTTDQLFDSLTSFFSGPASGNDRPLPVKLFSSDRSRLLFGKGKFFDEPHFFYVVWCAILPENSETDNVSRKSSIILLIKETARFGLSITSKKITG
jgi:hypothetical protein